MPIFAGLASNSRTREGFIFESGSGNFNNAVAVDSNGNSFYIGTGGHLRKVGPTGALLWQTDWSLDTFHDGVRISPTTQQVIVFGWESANNRPYVLWLNNGTGAIELQRYLGTYNSLQYNDAASLFVDASGNVYLAFAETTATPTQVSHIIKLTSAGALSWARRIVNTGSDVFPYSIVVDTSSNVFVTVAYLVGGLYYNTGIFKYNSTGTLQWQRALTTGSSNIFPNSGTIDSSGNLYVFSSGSGALLAKISTTGTLTWLSEFAATGGAVNADSSFVYIFKWGGAYVMKVNSSDGTLAWQRQIIGGTSNMYGYGIQASGNHIYFGGYGPASWGAKFPKSGGDVGKFTLGARVWTWAPSTQAFTGNTNFFSFITPALTSGTVTPTVTAGTSTNPTSAFSYSYRRI